MAAWWNDPQSAEYKRMSAQGWTPGAGTTGTQPSAGAFSGAGPRSSAGDEIFAKLFQNGALQQYGLTYRADGSEGPNTPYWQSAGSDNSQTATSIAKLQPYMSMSGTELMNNWANLPADIKAKLGNTPEEFAKKVSYEPDGKGGWVNTFVEKPEGIMETVGFPLAMALVGGAGAWAPGAAGAGAGAAAGEIAALTGSGTTAGAGAFGGAGAAGAAGSAVDPSWYSDWGSNTGFGNMDAGAFTPPAGTDFTQIDQMIENLGANAGEAENLATAQSIAQQTGMPLSQAKTLLNTAKSLGSSVLSSMGGLKGLIPVALATGLFETNTNPLTSTVTQAASGAMSNAGAFANMAPVGMQPSWQKAINLANSNVGAWKPYVDQAATYTNQAAGGLPSVDLSQYMNPYIDNVLTPQLRNINLAADKERMRLAHLAKISGNDTYAMPGSTSATRYGVEEGTLNDNRFKQIGDATGLAYKGAFDTATGLATTDLNRKMTAGGAFNTLANTVGTQGRGDVATLAGAGDLEAKPQQNKLDHAADASKLYTSIIPGTTSAITATNKPSVLGQAVGAFGAYNAANKAGWFD